MLHLWPAGYTYGLIVQKLDGLHRVERLTSAENTYIYRCTVKDGRQVLVRLLR